MLIVTVNQWSSILFLFCLMCVAFEQSRPQIRFKMAMEASSVVILRSYDMVSSRSSFLSLMSKDNSRRSAVNDLCAPSHPDLPKQELPPHFVGCCRGLICMQYDNLVFVLWNPATNVFKRLPPIDLKESLQPTSCCNDNSSPFVPGNVMSLGYDPISDDIKFVAFIYLCHGKRGDDPHYMSLKVVRYSLKCNSWQEIQYPVEYRCLGLMGGNAFCIDGFCYWLCLDSIVSFSFTTEKFSAVPYPDPISNGVEKYGMEYDILLIELEGTLGAVVYPKYGNEKLFSFLVWKGGSWCVRKSNLNVHVLVVGATRPLGLFYDNLLFEGRDGELLEYDCREKNLERIDQVFDLPDQKFVFPFVKTTTHLPNGKNVASTLEENDKNK